MIYKVGLCGASGRMGQELTALLGQGYEIDGAHLELADIVVGKSPLVSIEGVDVRKLGQPAREPVHVWVDFSRPAATLALLREIETPVVIGTTGFSDDEMKAVGEYAEKHPVLLASNTSPGMAIVRRMLKAIPPTANRNFEAVLTEEHHRHKKDAPSGTAKTMLGILAERGYPDIPVHVTRAGAIIGTHAVQWISDEEEITLVHRVSNRRVFAKGALIGAVFLAKGKKPGLYSMDDVF